MARRGADLLALQVHLARTIDCSTYIAANARVPYLPVVQGKVKRDPESYEEEFQLQVGLFAGRTVRIGQAVNSLDSYWRLQRCLLIWLCFPQYRHYKACLDIFSLKPSEESHEFADLVSFVAQVSMRPT